jgi:glutamate--cysteine ligase
MARDSNDLTPIASRDELVGWIEAGAKGNGTLKVGTEHEKFPYRPGSFDPVPYEGMHGIEALLKAFGEATGWDPIIESGNWIGLADPKGGGAISLEPGGQFELSGATVESLHETASETADHLALADRIGAELGMKFLLLGASPIWSRAETPVMPKSRYKIMMNYMPKVGARGLDMMFRTCTVQANLDYRDEADMVKKLRVSIALQPIATALFANSPFLDRKATGFQSTRGFIWEDTDRNRTGMLPFVFEDGFGYERYVDYALDVPMYFVKRGDHYNDVTGQSFRDLLDGTLPSLPGEKAAISDWANHLSTIFPEVRLKRYLEMRGADVGPAEMINALSAFWVGLLYDKAALDAAYELIKPWTAAERQGLREAIARQGLASSICQRSIREIANDLMKLATDGLKRRGMIDAQGRDETVYLEPLERIVDRGETLSQHVLKAWNEGSAHPLLDPYRARLA